jgi:hypothetical protein
MRSVLRWLAKQAREVDRVNAVIHVPEARVASDRAHGTTRHSMVGERDGMMRGRRCARA